MIEEEWRDIEGFPGYTVSNLGRVCSVKRGRPIIMKVHKNKYGYLQLDLSDENKTAHSKTTHRLVISAFIPNTYAKPEINHKDGCKTNNNVSNLEWATGSENMTHAYATGLHSSKRGKKHPHLTEEQIIEIYKMAQGESHTLKEIGGIFGVSPATVSFIKTGRSWKELTANINLQTQEQMQVSIC